METISEFKGLNGNIVAFKEAVGDVEKVTFLGTPGVCTPFAALFSYAIRNNESHFISGTDIEKCHQLDRKSTRLNSSQCSIYNAVKVNLI